MSWMQIRHMHSVMAWEDDSKPARLYRMYGDSEEGKARVLAIVYPVGVAYS